MVFLTILAISGSATFNKVINSWSNSIAGTVTIQVPNIKTSNDLNNVAVRSERIIRELEKDSNVLSARLLSKEEVTELLTPWIGNANINLLPLPQLIDVVLLKSTEKEEKALQSLVYSLVPDAIIDNHRLWFEHLLNLMKGFKFLTSSVASLITTALILTIVYATKASITEFYEVIRVLHLVGAKDVYIATQFAKRAFSYAFKGSLSGLIIGSVTIITIAILVRRMQSDFIPDLYLWLDLVILLPMVAITAISITVITAFITVLNNLRSLV
ncbi:MAG: hypothetical protein CMM25_08345 [Rhodospirillaceae bacterium]|nr:hypothetical protein [Rhodospirillaceae bacterium]